MSLMSADASTFMRNKSSSMFSWIVRRRRSPTSNSASSSSSVRKCLGIFEISLSGNLRYHCPQSIILLIREKSPSRRIMPFQSFSVKIPPTQPKRRFQTEGRMAFGFISDDHVSWISLAFSEETTLKRFLSGNQKARDPLPCPAVSIQGLMQPQPLSLGSSPPLGHPLVSWEEIHLTPSSTISLTIQCFHLFTLSLKKSSYLPFFCKVKIQEPSLHHAGSGLHRA